MKNYKALAFGSAAPLALLAAFGSPALAGTIDGFNGVSGAGFVFSDPAEGVEPPGIKVITNQPNTEFDDTDTQDANDAFNVFSPQGIDNCIMANSAAVCTSGPDSGKRLKSFLTGPGGIDLSFGTSDSGGTTEYFVYGKTSNTTGARILGFDIDILSDTGAVTFDDLVDLTAIPALDDPDTNRDEVRQLEQAIDWPDGNGDDGQTPIARINLPDGLFGNGGQEADTGFFDDERAGFILTQNPANTAITSNAMYNFTDSTVLPMANTAYGLNFGEGLLDESMVPQALFWDGTPAVTDDESVLVAWYDLSANGGTGAWVYGDLGAATRDLNGNSIPDLEDIAADLGLADTSALGYAPGATISDPALVAALTSTRFSRSTSSRICAT